VSSILPHGGVLINRLASEEQRAELLREAKELPAIIINNWTISDLDLIGVGAFSPLEGFMNEADYKSVVERIRLSDSNVWSIPITRALLRDGICPPPEFSRPEVASILIEGMAQQPVN